MYLTTNVLGETRATGRGRSISSSVEGELQQHTDYSTLLVSPHFTVATNITLHWLPVTSHQSPVAISTLTRHT